MSERDPQIGRAALEGLKVYQRAPRPPSPPQRPEAARLGPAALQDHGGDGPPAVLIPSLINPPNILDLDSEVSLASAVGRMNRRTLLLDWGPARDRADLSISEHVEELLVPLLSQLDQPAALVGYCLGGTMAIAAANLQPVERVITLAAPWHFSRYPRQARAALEKLWSDARRPAEELGALPMEVLQAGFWSLDPERSVRKFSRFAETDPDSRQARRFVALEDWANEGEPLPCPAARELFEDFFAEDLPGTGRWQIGGSKVTDRLPVPSLHCTAERDRITPAEAAPSGPTVEIGAGHVGMVVGSRRSELHEALRAFLEPGCR